MTGRPMTRMLALLVLTLAIAVAAAYARLTAARDGAVADARDLRICRDDLRDLTAWHATSPGATTADDLELTREVRRAATAAAVADQLASIEPGPPARVRDADVVRTPVYLRLDGVSLPQVVAFVRSLTAADRSVRATGIELSAPTGPAAPTNAAGGEVWTADLTLSQTAAARS